MELRPYQEQAKLQNVKQYKQFSCFMQEHTLDEIAGDPALQSQYNALRFALTVMPTGCGKTVVFSATELEIRNLFESATGNGLSTLIITHRQELLTQAGDKYRMLAPGARIGLVGDGIAQYGAPLTVANVATVSRPNHIRQLQNFNYPLVIVDEAHHVAASGYQSVLDALPGAFVMLVTATPDRLDGQPICSNAPVFNMSIIDAVTDGFLSPPTVVAVRTDTDLTSVKKVAGDYNAGQLEEIIDNPKRNKRIFEAYQEHAAGRQFLGFAVTVAHAENLATVFNLGGVRVAVVSGTTPSEERKRILKDFEKGLIIGLWNCGVLTEGYDNPEVSCIIMARPTQSRALFVQCIGRGLRLAPGKKDCMLLDITDNCYMHRLEPVKLASITGIEQKEGESLIDALERIEKEEEEKGAAAERRIRMKKRQEDITLNLLVKFEWKKKDNGYYVVEVGKVKHKIALIPDTNNAGLWKVGARLAPDFKFQWWHEIASPLDWAMQKAESDALKLQDNPKAITLVDRSQPWRNHPASLEQIAKLDKWGVPYPRNEQGYCEWTKGQASDAIGEKLEQFARNRAAKEAKKLAQAEQKVISA